MLKNNKLLIDKDCPMCNIYGNAFCQLELIDQNTLNPYQTIDESYAEHIDMHRAKSEIAFFNTESHTTEYGLDALIAIIAQGRDRFKAFLKSPLMYWPLLKLYRFISFNRKVIAPARPKANERNCEPDFHLGYRWAYLLFVALVTGFILNRFTLKLAAGFGLSFNPWQEYAICIGQIIWQYTLIYTLAREKLYAYLGNMSTVSMIGGLLLVPVLLANHYLHFSPLLLLFCFGAIVAFMLIEHIRRCKIMDLSNAMTVSWVIYRLVVLAVLFYCYKL